MIKKSKKGQAPPTGGGAAILIAVIAVLIVLYILFLPPAEREKILEEAGEEGEETEEEKEREGVNKTLLFEHPGQLSYLKQDKITHDIPSVNLYTVEEAAELKEVNSMYIEKALFTEEFQNISFKVENLENYDSFLLAFLVKKYEGRLIIKLNNREIFNREVKTENIEPIKLPKELIKEGENMLRFGVSSPELAFWKKNEYLLEKIVVIADITDVTKRESKSIFLISEDEYNNLETVRLKFISDCKIDEVGPLEVTLNNQVVFSGIPDCGMLNIYEIAPFRLRSGENMIGFKAESGFYIIDTIEIENKLKEPQDYVYYFELSKEDLDNIEEGKVSVNLTFEFVDDSWKDARLVVNGKYLYINTRELTYSYNLDIYAAEGYNSIKIEPERTMWIRNIIVQLN